MSEYREIQGATVQNIAGDGGTIEGQVWYNSSSNNFKVKTYGSGTWATGNVMPYTARDSGGFGITTASVIYGGYNPPSVLTTCVEYDGTNYASATAFPTSVQGLQSEGTQTAGFSIGGGPAYENKFYDGSAWTAKNAMDKSRTGHGSAGGPTAQAAALAAGGEPAPSQTTSSDWDGTCWTAGAAVPSWAQGTSGGGTPSEAWMQANVNSETAFKLYNGSTWSDGTACPGEHNYGGGGGTVPTCITFGGGPSPVGKAVTNMWDGSAWSTGGNLNEGRGNLHGAGTMNGSTDCMIGGGNPATPTGATNATEEWTGPAITVKTISTS